MLKKESLGWNQCSVGQRKWGECWLVKSSSSSTLLRANWVFKVIIVVVGGGVGV